MLQQRQQEPDLATSSGLLYVTFFAKNSMLHRVSSHLHLSDSLAEEVDTQYRPCQSGYKSSLRGS